MAAALIKARIKTIVISDLAVFAFMRTVSKVILCKKRRSAYRVVVMLLAPQAIMADGGIISKAGGLLLALAANHQCIPFIVLAGMYKLTPEYSFEQDTFNELIPPGKVFKTADFENPDNIEIYVPKYNYIKPEFISLYITDYGEHTPAYIYRLFSEYYSTDSNIDF